MKTLQRAVIAFGLFDLLFTIGYYFQLPWATDTWPWPDVTPLDFILISSFLGGATVVILWLGYTREWGAGTGATMNVGLMKAGAAVYLYQAWGVTHEERLLHRAIAFTVFSLANLGVLVWSLRHPIRDKRG